MKTSNQEKMNLTVEVFDFLHDSVYNILAKHGDVDKDEHGALLTEVVTNLYQFTHRNEKVN
jgi:hypothetical protein